MTTALDLIESALRKIHVLGRGQSLINEEAQDALNTFNQLLDSWTVEGALVFTETIESFPLTGAVSYTIGQGADFDTERPVDIVVAYTSNGDTDYALLKYDQTQYAGIRDKNTSGIPRAYYYNGNFPIGTIFFDRIPTSVSTVVIHSYKPLTNVSDLNATLVLPPGYERSLIYNLAIDLAPDYEREPSPSIIAVAQDSKTNLINANTLNDNFLSRVDSSLQSHGKYYFDVRRGYD